MIIGWRAAGLLSDGGQDGPSGRSLTVPGFSLLGGGWLSAVKQLVISQLSRFRLGCNASGSMAMCCQALPVFSAFGGAGLWGQSMRSQGHSRVDGLLGGRGAGHGQEENCFWLTFADWGS